MNKYVVIKEFHRMAPVGSIVNFENDGNVIYTAVYIDKTVPESKESKCEYVYNKKWLLDNKFIKLSTE